MDEDVKTADETVSPEAMRRAKAGDFTAPKGGQFPPVLSVQCPRCSAVGTVRDAANGYCAVDWSGQGGSWRDTNVRLEDLADPSFGCGFDPCLPDIGPDNPF